MNYEDNNCKNFINLIIKTNYRAVFYNTFKRYIIFTLFNTELSMLRFLTFITPGK